MRCRLTANATVTTVGANVTYSVVAAWSMHWGIEFISGIQSQQVLAAQVGYVN